MNFVFLAGSATAAAIGLTLVLIITYRLFHNISLFALLAYYALTGFYILMALKTFDTSQTFKTNMGHIINLLDAPLMLLTMLFFCTDVRRKKMIHYTIAAFVLYEIIVCANMGVTMESRVLILGPGVVIVLLMAFYFFMHFGKLTIVQGKALGQTMMLIAIILMYSCFLVLYYIHYLAHSPAMAEVYIVYYIGLFIATVLINIGLVWVVQRMRTIDALHQTRRELALFFEK